MCVCVCVRDETRRASSVMLGSNASAAYLVNKLLHTRFQSKNVEFDCNQLVATHYRIIFLHSREMVQEWLGERVSELIFHPSDSASLDTIIQLPVNGPRPVCALQKTLGSKAEEKSGSSTWSAAMSSSSTWRFFKTSSGKLRAFSVVPRSLAR